MPIRARLCLLFTPAACRHEPFWTLAEAIAGGVDLVQWRCKTPEPAEPFARCRAVCQQYGVPLIVNDDVMLAVRSAAAGAHVGQDDIPADAARRLLAGRWLGVSTHDREQLAAAAASGADYAGFGPCHATATKGYQRGVGDEAIGAAVDQARALRLPLFAIGGIRADNLPRLRGLGVDRIAVAAFVLAHDDPRRAAAELRRQL